MCSQGRGEINFLPAPGRRNVMRIKLTPFIGRKAAVNMIVNEVVLYRTDAFVKSVGKSKLFEPLRRIRRGLPKEVFADIRVA